MVLTSKQKVSLNIGIKNILRSEFNLQVKLFLQTFKTLLNPNQKKNQAAEILRKCSPATNCNMSYAICHVSHVTWHMTCVRCNVHFFSSVMISDKLVILLFFYKHFFLYSIAIPKWDFQFKRESRLLLYKNSWLQLLV